jgi:hypothetical protein
MKIILQKLEARMPDLSEMHFPELDGDKPEPLSLLALTAIHLFVIAVYASGIAVFVSIFL